MCTNDSEVSIASRSIEQSLIIIPSRKALATHSSGGPHIWFNWIWHSSYIIPRSSACQHLYNFISIFFPFCSSYLSFYVVLFLLPQWGFFFFWYIIFVYSFSLVWKSSITEKNMCLSINVNVIRSRRHSFHFTNMHINKIKQTALKKQMHVEMDNLKNNEKQMWIASPCYVFALRINTQCFNSRCKLSFFLKIVWKFADGF